MHFVDLPGDQALPNDRHSTADANILALGRLFGFLESRFQSVGDEVKRIPSLHRNRNPRVMSKHKDRSMKRRIIAPPPFPRIVFPRTSNRPKHIPANTPRANFSKSLCGSVPVNARAPAALTMRFSKCLGQSGGR